MQLRQCSNPTLGRPLFYAGDPGSGSNIVSAHDTFFSGAFGGIQRAVCGGDHGIAALSTLAYGDPGTEAERDIVTAIHQRVTVQFILQTVECTRGVAASGVR
jgi:hypothetical protein